MMSRDGGFGNLRGGLTPILRSEDVIDEYLEAIKQNLLSKEDTIKELREQLKVARDEAYASTEMQEMKSQLETFKKDYYRGFPISETENNQITEWQKNHDATEHNNPKQFHGCSGGGYVYEFYPTGIGTSGVCVCCSCRNMAHRAAATVNTPAVKKNGYDRKVYEAYMEEHNGEFEFQELG